MNRRDFGLGLAMTGLAALTGGFATDAMARRSHHAEAMATSKAEIRRFGALRKASGWTDGQAHAGIVAEARVFATHHRALARLQGLA